MVPKPCHPRHIRQQDHAPGHGGHRPGGPPPPEELLARYPKERADYQRATAVTRRTYDYIRREPCIKAVFAGHTHENFESALEGGLPQYTTGGTFRGEARLISVE